MSEWQPIETAPKSEDVLVHFGGITRVANHSAATGKWLSEYGHELKKPTHWMPLPQPPKGE